MGKRGRGNKGVPASSVDTQSVVNIFLVKNEIRFKEKKSLCERSERNSAQLGFLSATAFAYIKERVLDFSESERVNFR